MQRGIECAPCRRSGHHCPAVADDDEAKCLDCVNEQPCAALRCVGKVREESGVRLQPGDFGFVEFCGDVGEVVSRTPEELGLERVVVAAQAAPSWWGQAPRPAKRAERTEAQVEQLRASLGMAPLRMIGGEPVRMPANATIGAEPLDGFIAERLIHEESKMPKSNGRVPEDIRKQILIEPASESNGAVGRKYGVAEGTVWYIRNRAGIRSTAGPGARVKAAQPPRADLVRAAVERSRERTNVEKPVARPAAIQRVEIDPQRDGSAAALMKALRVVDDKETITLEFALPEVAEILCALNSDRRKAFLAAGLKAALLG